MLDISHLKRVLSNVGILHVVGACRDFWRLGRFFNGHWQEVAAKDTLSRYVSKLTGIPESVLVTPPRKVIDEFPIARRISCIAGRQTTRIETIPYSLPGILNIHIHAHAIRRRGHGFSATTYKRKSFGSTTTCQPLLVLGTRPPSGFMHVLAPSPSCFKTGAIQDESKASDGTLHWGDRLRTQFSTANQPRGVCTCPMRQSRATDIVVS